MDDFKAAGIIVQAFPESTMFWEPHPNIQVESFHDALMYATTKCGSNTLGECIKWARKYLKDYNLKC